MKFWLHLRTSSAVTRRRWQSRTGNDDTWPEVCGSDAEVMSFNRKTPGRGCRRPISQFLGAFEHLQGCNSEEVAVT